MGNTSRQQGERWFATLIEQSHDPIALVQLDGTITYISPSIERLTGYSVAEYLNRNFFTLQHPDDVAVVRARIDQIKDKAGATTTVKYRRQIKNGAWIWIEAVVTNQLAHPQLQALLMNYHDVTEAEQTKRQIQESQEQYRALMEKYQCLLEREKQARAETEAARQHLYDLFMQAPANITITSGPEHRITLMNPNTQQTIGRRDILGKPLREAIPELVEQGLLSLLDQVYRTGQPVIGKERLIRFDKYGTGHLENGHFNFTYQPARNAQGEVEGIMIYGVEVTELVEARQRAEELANQLEAEHARLEQVLQQMPYGVIIVEAPTHKIVLCNQQLEQILGLTFPANSILEYDQYRGYHPDGRRYEPEEWPLYRVVTKGETIQGEEITYVRDDGTSIILRVNAAPIYNTRGEIIAGVTVLDDITRRKQFDTRKDTFISMAGHELKTPLAALKGYSQLLQRRLKRQNDEQAKQFINKIEAQTTRLHRLIDDLLDLSKIQSGRLELHTQDLMLDILVHEVVDNIQMTTQSHTLRIEGKTDAIIHGDRDRLGQVFTNLLTNALKYSPDADTIIIHLRTENKWAVVSVQDFGIGISREHQQRIFERFYQVRDDTGRTFSGLGLGLYITNEIIKAHQGQMHVESTPGQGSIFSILLPIKS